MDSKSITCFIALYEERNMRKAAERLFITQQGVSRIIISLEKELGCALFERRRAGLEPTREGTLLYGTAVKIESELTELKQEVTHLRQEQSRISMVSSFGGISTLYSEIKKYQDDNPEIELSWSEHSDDECFRKIDSREADIGVVLIGRNDNAYRSELLLRKRICVLVKEGHPFYKKNKLNLEDVKNHRVITFGNSQHFYDHFRQRCIDAGFYPEMGNPIESVSLLYNMVSADEGIGIINEDLSDIISFPGIRAIPFNKDDIMMDYFLAQRSSAKNSPVVTGLWEYLLKAAAQHKR